MNTSIHPLLKANKVMLLAGVYDVLSAKIAQRVGFPAVVLTGYGCLLYTSPSPRDS